MIFIISFVKFNEIILVLCCLNNLKNDLAYHGISIKIIHIIHRQTYSQNAVVQNPASICIILNIK